MYKWDNIEVAINFHAFGNLMCIPFNGDNSGGNNEGLTGNQKYERSNRFYGDLDLSNTLPENNRMGPGPLSIGYTASGEASDWMLHDLGITAMTAELGLDYSETFWFIIDRESVNDVVKKNAKWVEFTMEWFSKQPEEEVTEEQSEIS
jgi:hypothetical protein